MKGPAKKGSELPDLEVRVNGRPLPQQARRDLRQATVEESLDAASMFSIVLYNWDESRQRFSWSDDDLFAPGAEVELRFGTLGSLQTVLIGEITGLEPVFEAQSPRMLIVRGYDHRHRLMRARRTRTFTNLKDSDIARQIARQAGLGAQVSNSEVKLTYVLQHNQTDLEFLQARAARIGYELFVRDKILYFRQPKFDQPARETLSLNEDIISFYPRLTTMSQVSGLQVQGWDVARKEAVQASAAAGQEAGLMNGRTSGPRASRQAFDRQQTAIVKHPVTSKTEANGLARGQFNQMALNYIGGEGSCYGRADLHAGEVVAITGAGSRFSGDYYLTGVTHSITPQQGFRTHFRVQRNAT